MLGAIKPRPRKFTLTLLALTALLAGCLVLTQTGTAHATGSGDNGKIAFTRVDNHERAIFTANSDGTGEQRLALPANATEARNPKWSPTDPNKLLATIVSPGPSGDESRIYLYNDLTQSWKLLPGEGDGDVAAAWNPAGDRIVVQHGERRLFIMDADGQNVVGLYDAQANQTIENPLWPGDDVVWFTVQEEINGRYQKRSIEMIHGSIGIFEHLRTERVVDIGMPIYPRATQTSSLLGNSILTSGHFVTRQVPGAAPAGGSQYSNGKRLIEVNFDTGQWESSFINMTPVGDDFSPEWSPDGTKVAFVSRDKKCGDTAIYVADVVRSPGPYGDRIVRLENAKQITAKQGWNSYADISWQAIPRQAPASGAGSSGAGSTGAGGSSGAGSSGAGSTGAGGSSGAGSTGANGGGNQTAPPVTPAPIPAKPASPIKQAAKPKAPVKAIAPVIKKLRLTARHFKKRKPATVKFHLTMSPANAQAKVELRVMRIGKGFPKNGKLVGFLHNLKGRHGDKNSFVLRNLRMPNGKTAKFTPAGTYRLIVQAVGQGKKAAKPMAITFTVKP